MFLVNHDGIVTCLEAKSGKNVWKKRLPGDYSASPLESDGRLYFFNEDSVCSVVRAARKFEVLATNKLGDELLMASPAAAGSSLFVRTEGFLYRIDSAK